MSVRGGQAVIGVLTAVTGLGLGLGGCGPAGARAGTAGRSALTAKSPITEYVHDIATTYDPATHVAKTTVKVEKQRPGPPHDAVYTIIGENASLLTGDKEPGGTTRADWFVTQGKLKVDGRFSGMLEPGRRMPAVLPLWYLVVSKHIGIGVDGSKFDLEIKATGPTGFPLEEIVTVPNDGQAHRVLVVHLKDTTQVKELTAGQTATFRRADAQDPGTLQ